MITYILIAVGVLLLIFVIAAFNSLSKRRNQIENAISSLDALFIQRAPSSTTHTCREPLSATRRSEHNYQEYYATSRSLS